MGFPDAKYTVEEVDALLQAMEGRLKGSNSAVFTVNGNFTVPAGINTVYLTGCAAGNAGAAGGGSTTYGTSTAGTGGWGGNGGNAGEAVQDYPISVTPGEVVAVTVGAGNTVFKELTLRKGCGKPGGKGGAGMAGSSTGGSSSAQTSAGGVGIDNFGNGLPATAVPPSGYGCGGGGGAGGAGARVFGGGFIPSGGGGTGAGQSAWGSVGLAGSAGVLYGDGGGGGGGAGGSGAYKNGTISGGAGGAGAAGCLIVRW